jgi:hypothetical protein
LCNLVAQGPAPEIMQEMAAADQALIPTEKFAQPEEKMVNGELQAAAPRLQTLLILSPWG